MTISRILSALLLAILSVLITACSDADVVEPSQSKGEQAARPESVLIFSKTAGWVHDSIPEGVEALTALVKQKGLTPVATGDASVFTDAQLSDMAAIVFVNTTGDILNDQQQLAMERYIQAGGGFMGIHSATDTEHEGDWYWYRRLIGAVFKSHPNDPSNVQQAKVKVVDNTHASTKGLPREFYVVDEWYDFHSLSDQRHDLMVVDESTYQGGTHGDYHPIAWYHEFDGGRSFYTGFGHTKQSFQDEWFVQHLSGGLDYAMGERSGLDYSAARPDPNHFVRQTLVNDLDEPVSFDITADYSGAMIAERQGNLFWLDVASKKTHTMAVFDVFAPAKKIEFGLIAVTFDPDFDDNQLIYAMYNLADASGEHDLLQRIAQFKVVDKTLDMASEKVLIDIPNDNTCCHTGGSMEFDRDGNLFIALGDNSNPFESNDSGPMNNKPDGTHHDALRSSANSQDLRGKILRITPDKNGAYSVPQGNLFSSAEQGRPEIYVMGTRNPYTIALDERTGDLYFGDIGPDAHEDSEAFGPRGYDEINKVTQAGFFGWPAIIGNNRPYRMYDYAAEQSGDFFNPLAVQNFSPRNTGLKVLPPAQPALIWYPYKTSERFPELGQGGRNALTAGVYPTKPEADLAYPAYYQDKLFIGDFMRSWVKVVTLDDYDKVVKIEDFAPAVKFAGPLDMKITPDGRLWVLEYGTQWWAGAKEAQLSFIEYDPNAAPTQAAADDSADPSTTGLGHEAQLMIAQGKELAEKTSCLACHKEDAASVGPSFLQIKQAYQELNDPEAYIMETIAKGSNGKWGEHVMPAHSFLDEPTRKKIAHYILSVTPSSDSE